MNSYITISTLLVILKYLGLCLAAGSSIWATVNELTVKDAVGDKKLTTAGRVAISLTIAGLLISLISEDLHRRDVEASRKEQIIAETRRTNAIIVGGQQLSSLSLHLAFTSTNAALWDAMDKGKKEIQENIELTQGGLPLTPFDLEEFEAAVVPLLSNVAYMVGGASKNEAKATAEKQSVVALLALDPSHNTILSLGTLIPETRWSNSQGTTLLSAGFLMAQGARTGGSTPHVEAKLGSPRRAVSEYSLDWDLDPDTLYNSINRRNMAVPPTAKLPDTVKLALLYDISQLPFTKNNFALALVSLWDKNEYARDSIDLGPGQFSIATVAIEVNGVADPRYNYSFRKVYKLRLLDEFDEEVDASCIIFEFQQT